MVVPVNFVRGVIDDDRLVSGKVFQLQARTTTSGVDVHHDTFKSALMRLLERSKC
jgi:hypothetical protein